MNALPTAFTKYHGNGNDFIIFDLVQQSNRELLERIVSRASQLCDRHRGIGADGILVLSENDSHFLMTIVNADGSFAANCGNGLRCAADYLFRHHHQNKNSITIEVGGSSFVCARVDGMVEVAMGTCRVTAPQEIALASTSARVTWANASIGNKHTLFIFDRCVVNYEEILAEVTAKFSDINDTNIGFIFVDDSGQIISRVHERGVGWTKSCGTGACVAAAALATKNPVTVRQPGGDLSVRATRISSSSDGGIYDIMQRGEAEVSFTGLCQL